MGPWKTQRSLYIHKYELGWQIKIRQQTGLLLRCIIERQETSQIARHGPGSNRQGPWHFEYHTAIEGFLHDTQALAWPSCSSNDQVSAKRNCLVRPNWRRLIKWSWRQSLVRAPVKCAILQFDREETLQRHLRTEQFRSGKFGQDSTRNRATCWHKHGVKIDSS